MKKEIEHLDAFAYGHKFGMELHTTVADMMHGVMRDKLNHNVEALILGFEQAKKDIIEYNGKEIYCQKPYPVFGLKELSDFAYDGMFGIHLNEEQFTPTQWKHIQVFYSAGVQQREEDWIIQVGQMLQNKGIRTL